MNEITANANALEQFTLEVEQMASDKGMVFVKIDKKYSFESLVQQIQEQIISDVTNILMTSQCFC